MNVISLNRNSTNRKNVCNLISSGKVDFCLIQETKQDMYDSLVHSIWGNKDVSWSAKKSTG